MSWKSERLMSLSAHVFVVTAIAVLFGAGLGAVFGAARTGALIGLGLSGLYILSGYLVMRDLSEYRRSVEHVARPETWPKKDAQLNAD